MEDGMVNYYVFDLGDNIKKDWHYRQESYATSREIVIYQREAEKKYRDIYQQHINVFGDARYFPPGTPGPN